MPGFADTEGMEVKVNKTKIIAILITIIVYLLDSCIMLGKHSILYQYK